MFDIAKYEQKIDKLISNNFNCSYMSNSKWIKLFKALDHEHINFNHISLKKINNLESIYTYMPKSEDLETKWVSEGYNEFNYFYKEIEWIEFLTCYKPSNIPAQYVYQSIDEVCKIISSLGQFEMVETKDGFKILGYKKT
jgi:hypothetical protein